jgi:hypothetical protein
MKQVQYAAALAQRSASGLVPPSPFLSLTRSPASTPYCDAGFGRQARLVDFASGDSTPAPFRKEGGGWSCCTRGVPG